MQPKALGDLDVVDAVAAELRRVDVVEGELDAVIHVEAALRLADQAEVGVVHDDMEVGQLELRADREFLDHELEVVVAGQRHDPCGPGRPRARRAPPASSSRAGRPGRS